MIPELDHSLKNEPDAALIRELKTRGYMVLKKEKLFTLGARSIISKDELISQRSEAMGYVVRDLANALASHYSRHPAFPIEEVERGLVNIAYETRIDILLREPMDPSNPNYPLWLSAEEFRR